MSSQAQIIANRQNCRKSTGPKSHKGKSVVAQNAVKHGLTSANDIISSESRPEFDQFQEQMLAELSPQTPVESVLADRIVTLSWRLKRTGRLQNQVIDALKQAKAKGPLAKIAQSLLSKHSVSQMEPPDSDDSLTFGRMAVKDFSDSRVLERLLMYERRIEHSLYKTILEYQRLKLISNIKNTQPTPNTL